VLASSSAGVTTSAVVPGTTVLFTTTVCQSAFEASVSPSCLAPVSSTDRSMLPSAVCGVGRQRNVMSVSRTASYSVVALRRLVLPSPAWLSISAGSRSSWIGAVPAVIVSTMVSSISTLTTSWPSSAKHAAMVVPTYPEPMTESFIPGGELRLSHGLLGSQYPCAIPRVRHPR
jgi:hypothetical protein